MNRGGRTFRAPLPPCPRCGKDAGRRLVTDTAIESFFVRCQNCGYQTPPRKTQAAATKTWIRGK